MKSLKTTLLVLVFIVSTIFVASPVFASEEEGGSVYNYEITDVTQTAPDTIVVTARCRFCWACNPNYPGWPDRGDGCIPFACGYPPPSFPSYASCQKGSPDGRFAAVRISGSFGSKTQKLVCDQSNWPLNTLWSHNFVFSGLTLQSGETITVEADFYCSYCRHWYATPQEFVTNKYSIVFVPLNWQGDLSSFYAEAQTQAEFVINNVGVLTDENTEVLKVQGWNLVLDFDKTNDGWKSFNRWADISQFAINHGYTGDRYVAITNEEIWGGVEGLSNWGPVVVVEQGATHVTAHELGHSWGCLDEYRWWYWITQAITRYWYPIGFPPNSYPGDDPGMPGGSLGRAFDGKRCIMGSANPADRAFCPAHTKDEGFPVGVRNYVGCAAHVDFSIQQEWAASSTGLVSSRITFYRDGSPPTVEEIEGVSIVGKPMQYFRPSNYSMQIYSEEGDLIYNSNMTASFWLLPSQPIEADQPPIQADIMTVHWLAPTFSEHEVTLEIKDNVENEVITSQVVHISPIAGAWIDYKTTDKDIYDFGEIIEVATEINTTYSSMEVVLDITLLDPNDIAQDYESWTGTIYPSADPVTLYLNIPSSGTDGTWTVYVAVLNSTGQLQDSKSNLITIGGDTTSPVTTLTIGSPQYIDGLNNVYVTSATSFILDAIDDGGTGSGVALTGYRYNTGWKSGVPPLSFQIEGVDDGPYRIDYNSTDNAGNVELTKNQTVFLDNTPPIVTETNFEGLALQDGVTFEVAFWDSSEVSSVTFSIQCTQGEIIPPFESMPATHSPDCKWRMPFDTTLLPDGFYLAVVNGTDVLGNTGNTTIPFSIRNWACLELLPACESNKAGRTMPVKFSLRIVEAVDPAQPFVYNEELTIVICEENHPEPILQESTCGDTARNYRIDSVDELYITNFQTMKKKTTTYMVEIWRKDMLIGSFEFCTVK